MVNHDSLAASVNLTFVFPFSLNDLSEPCQEDGVPLAVSLRWKWLKLVETFQWVVAIVPLQTSKTPGKKQGTFRDLDVSYPRWMRKALLVQWLKPGTWKPYRQSSGMNTKVKGNGGRKSPLNAGSRCTSGQHVHYEKIHGELNRC